MKLIQATEKMMIYMNASHAAYENTGLEYHAGSAKAYEHAIKLIMKVTSGLTMECSQELAQLCQFPLPVSDCKSCLNMSRQDCRK